MINLHLVQGTFQIFQCVFVTLDKQSTDVIVKQILHSLLRNGRVTKLPRLSDQAGRGERKVKGSFPFVFDAFCL